jgi:hypothetical protein
MMILRLLHLSAGLLLLALVLAGPIPEALAGGPYTVRGVLLDAQGKPVGDYPLRITPLLPVGGPDVENLGYRIANRDEHATHTDANGQFTLTKVIDYPEVQHHSYRIWAGSIIDEKQNLHPYVRVNYRLDLSTVQSPEAYVVIKTEPGSALRMVAKDRAGRPYNGTTSICVASGIHSFVMTAYFQDGVSFTPALPVGNARQMGRVIVLPEKTSKETMSKITATGQTLDSLMNAPFTEGALIDKSVPFLPFQTATVEVTVPE